MVVDQAVYWIEGDGNIDCHQTLATKTVTWRQTSIDAGISASQINAHTYLDFELEKFE